MSTDARSSAAGGAAAAEALESAGPATAFGSAGPELFASLPGPTSFLLLRHGQSEGNARRIMQGLLDLPLDDAGRAQAREAAPFLAGRLPGARPASPGPYAPSGAAPAGAGARAEVLVLHSPLARAAETARILAEGLGLGEPLAEPLLRELDTGVFSGMRLDEAEARFPEAYAGFKSRSWDGVPGAEGSAALYARAVEAWVAMRDLAIGAAARDGRGAAAAPPRALVAVTHGGFIQWLFRATFGCRAWMPLLTTSNLGLFELHVEPVPGGRPYMIWKAVDERPPAASARVSQVF